MSMSMTRRDKIRKDKLGYKWDNWSHRSIKEDPGKGG